MQQHQQGRIRIAILTWFFVLLAIPGLAGCQPKAKTQLRGEKPGERAVNVEGAIARTERLREPVSYTGTTQPFKEVSLRSRAEGRLLQLNANTGDRVQAGQILAQLDDTLLQTALSEAQAELAARESEVARARNQVRNAQVRVEQAQVERQQAQVDAQRFIGLAKAGAIPQQQADVARTEAAVATKTLRAAQEQVRIEQEAVTTAQERVKAQRSAAAQVRERRSYALLASPITGVVLQRTTEPGNLVQPGGEVLKLGDFSQVKVNIPVSEKVLSEIAVGQPATVRLDAFPDEVLQGRISRISPAADATTRQVPVEVIIANPDGKIGSGLLARVEFGRQQPQRVVIPESALQGEEKNTLFVLKSQGESATVEARTVQLGDRVKDRVEVRSGLSPGERFVVRSSRPLETGESVRVSILSESEKPKNQ
ncbi:efflux RND transporter periplasmic adaptor subunit [Lusitaniella coriacea LEGE 07157]|uniref:Efflux RND transporter periplasmic adaptor subunit n=1 Tax=Lusitaniella coriacea LEGE 07157 TaxID=945747 RepID=A0A8J7DVE8_9CYAN|nr:efflux RND transporter periplasmic adaptor subunit [Lusitaniella coriacea]MBE9115771.1 efflux RND transporter periplasmic adaptor subunit [Lusitaniella coriacea LEGE 07157]